MVPTLPTIEGFSRLKQVGSGGFSTVYSAHQDELGRLVALKVLNFRLDSEDEQQRFEAECRAMARLSNHPHIVPLYFTTYTADGFPVIVMQLYEGGTLNDRPKGDVKSALSAGVKVASALHFAHQEGVIHRDVKPKNVLLSEFGEPALTDFGISAITERVQTKDSSGITLAYAPPEALTDVADEQSDIYSLAATMYAVLAGHHPHHTPGAKQDLTELARKILYEDPPPLRNAGMSATFDAVLVRKGLAKEPEHRPADAQAFAELVRGLQRSEGLDVTPFVTALKLAQTEQADAAQQALQPFVDSPVIVDADPSVTIVRKAGAADPEAVGDNVAPAEPEATGWSARKLVAIGAGAMAIGLLALVIIFGRGGAEPELVDDPAPEQNEPDIGIYQAQLFAPTDVQMSRQLDGSVVVTWTDPNAEPATFEIQRLDGAAASEPIQTVTGTQHVLESISDTDSPCITMRAVGDRGAISRDLDQPVCLGVEIASGPVITMVPPSCAAGACSFRINATGVLPNGTVSILVEGPDGQDLNSAFDGIYQASAEVDSRGSIDWRFSPQSLAPTGDYRVVVTDTLSGQSSSGFFEIVDP